ncbi:MAG: DUF1573 domain-containing protein [Bacteroidales bacterium]|nr:DUF1573 domain-containing protein [Bacteroidales bacterium]
MKRLIILCLMIGGLFALQAQTTKTTPYKGNGAEIQFDKLTVDFGTLKVGDVKTVTITFTNIGKKPLILDDVISSCDCTTVEWSKQPIMPGKKGTIKATYTAKHTGLISKRLTVLSNANTDRVILQLKGEVK